MIGELIIKNEIAQKYLEELNIKEITWVEILKRISVDGTLVLRVDNNQNNLILSPTVQENFQLKILS